MPGIADVARLAGVSTATVSRALSGNGHVSPATRQRVAEAAASIGYVVSSNASSLASGRMKNVGVIVPFLDRWFYSSVIEGAETALLAEGYDLTLYNLTGGGDARRSVFESFLPRNRVDAVIAISMELREEELARLRSLDKPLVGVGGPIDGVRTLSVDDVTIARLATEHLLSLGHTRIAHIGGDSDSDRDFHLPLRRRIGYVDALEAAAIDVDPALLRSADFTIPGGYGAAKQLLGQPGGRPTAIFASSDEMAIGAILAARDLGLSVPRDVSIVGIDDHELAGFFGLSTVAQFPRRQGARAVEILLEELHTRAGGVNSAADPAPASASSTGLGSALDTSLPFELIVRSSTARPSA